MTDETDPADWEAHERAVDIARFLSTPSDPWRFDHQLSSDPQGESPDAAIVGRDMVLRVSGLLSFPKAHRGKIRIAVDMPRQDSLGRPYARGGERITIYVSAAHGPARIASNIRRRLLTKYERALELHAQTWGTATAAAHRQELEQRWMVRGQPFAQRGHTVYFDIGDVKVQIDYLGEFANVQFRGVPVRRLRELLDGLEDEAITEALAVLDEHSFK